MKFGALIIAAAFCTGAALAASPSDSDKAPSGTDATGSMSKSMGKHHRSMRMHHRRMREHHAMRHGMRHHHDEMGSSSAPSTDVDDPGRQSRMDEALTKYRQQHG